MFQSPYGDYLVRNIPLISIALIYGRKFQSPYGDYLVRNPPHKKNKASGQKLVSVPLRGLLS